MGVLEAELRVPTYEGIQAAKLKLNNVVVRTPLVKNLNFSERFDANVSFKREDLQAVRSYKIRGAYNKISSLSEEESKNGIVCASAGNHAQGVAYSCQKLGIRGTIFMPNVTPKQKISQVRMFGKDMVDVVLTGDTFDDSYRESLAFCEKNKATFVHPFDDEKVIEGQGTVALEILEDADGPIDYLFVPIGGGGLASGAITAFKTLSPNTKIIGVEPAGAPAMKESIAAGNNLMLDKIDTFIDGAAVKQVGSKTLEICKDGLDELVLVPEGKVCTMILQLYNQEAIVVEPAGALSLAALDFYKDKIQGKNVVCVVSGSNNDITRTEEIKERSLLYEGIKHYFIIRFPQRAGALREFLTEVLGPGDDIVHFEYSKKNSRENGPALIGLELQNKDSLSELFERLKAKSFVFEYLNEKPDLMQYLV
ncbi:threonine ammonia-lyase IlvA [Reichenbachiella carrageenanivorans]|uniref:L-threonine dehydratase n=1 Tax=Reichenbachiella carrageenanivorans TaxID=2979869 RepID=A0ABY6CZ92_9BACT|nr:threonine ammonia-lyase IlvA [Reichenbachiella carrageenanivorans]UXX79232.1 threonine ammonia-lyase IlvA [Reichenbachiella carrageenanivorans]